MEEELNPRILHLLKTLETQKDNLVKFLPRETVCPVCKYLGFDSVGKVKVLKTAPDGVRYCECRQCGAHFRAIGETYSDRKLIKSEKEKIEKVQHSLPSGKKANITKVKARKKGNGTRHDTRRTSGC